MDVVALYRRFGVKLPELGDGWVSCRCFAGSHRDRHPSARVHLRSGGFRCFTCKQAGGVLDALQLLGVHDRDEARALAVEYGIIEPSRAPVRRLPGAHRAAPARAAQAPPPPSGNGKVDYDNLGSNGAVRERTWVYEDAGGKPIGRVKRIDLGDGRKRIFQERPVGDAWAFGLEGARLPLYRLPQVLEHARRGLRVLIVEGEKACDALDRLGLFATTNPGGAGKWRDEHTAALAGAIALVIADCDLVGRLHATQVSAELKRNGVRVLAPLDPDPMRNDGYDIVDHLAAVAETVRAVTPELDERAVRERLHDHLQALLSGRVNVDTAELQRLAELAHLRDDPSGRALLECERCGMRRVHRLAAGLAYCPCGGHRVAPGA